MRISLEWLQELVDFSMSPEELADMLTMAGFEVEDIDSELERLAGEGFQLIHQTPKDGADNKRIAFLHPKSTAGLLVELCQEKIDSSKRS